MSGADADYRIAIDVQRFESVRGKSATLDAAWNRGINGEESTGSDTIEFQSMRVLSSHLTGRVFFARYTFLSGSLTRAWQPSTRSIKENDFALVRSNQQEQGSRYEVLGKRQLREGRGMKNEG